ncbi:MAG: shikimate dehydrogenase [Stappiaceae bacterium]
MVDHFIQAGVIGWPIAHSRSPIIHRYWLKELGIAGDYKPIAVSPEEIEPFFQQFPSSGLKGANVTIPHKEVALSACHDVNNVARKIGAVNTVWLEDERLLGTNTDAYGFTANMDDRAPGWNLNPGAAIILGAGGASRAIIWSLLSSGFDPIHIVNRTVSRGQVLADQFGPRVRAHEWNEIGSLLPSASLLVNSTSLGMKGQDPLAIDLASLPDTAVVADIVYVPLKTDLLRRAESRGLQTVDGLGMLLHQAVPGFERWFGKRPVVTENLRKLILTDLGEPS